MGGKVGNNVVLLRRSRVLGGNTVGDTIAIGTYAVEGGANSIVVGS